MIILMFISVPIFLLLPSDAYAYFDPGTGSFVLQMLVASLIGGLYAIKLYFAKLKKFFGDFFSRNRPDGRG